MQHVIVDTNVILSALRERNESQRVAAKELLLRAEAGDIVAVIPQFVLFEIGYVLRSLYLVDVPTAVSLIRDILALPGIDVIHDFSWDQALTYWSESFHSLPDAALLAMALSHRYETIATFDQRLTRRARELGLTSYW